MDASTEVADLVVKEGVQVAEGALKIAGSSLKNIAALLLALAKQDAKVVGKTTAKRLARDPNAAIVVQIPEADKSKFRRLAKKFGVLYFIAQKKGNQSGVINVVSNENYAAQLNAIMQELGYPLPEKQVEAAKKATPRTQSERSSPERRNGSTPRTGTQTSEVPEKPSVRKRLEALKQASDKMKNGPERAKEQTR